MKARKLSTGWEVEVCVNIPRIEGTTDADIDAAKYERSDFATKREAIRYAKANLHRDHWGCIRVSEFHSEPYEKGCLATYREYDREEMVEA